MTLRFAFTRPDGGLSIVVAAPKGALERVFGPLTDAQYRAHVIERSGITGDAEELPEDWTPPDDRTFRNAWVLRKGGVDVDMPKAREIHMARIRLARNRKLDLLDKEQLRGTDVAVEKQVLRDIPQTFDISKASTPEELKALWPEELA